MIEVIYVFVAVYLIEKGIHELALRRASAREAELSKQIRSLENRIHARDITSYIELERADKEHPARPLEAPVETTSQPGRFFDGNGAYEESPS